MKTYDHVHLWILPRRLRRSASCYLAWCAVVTAALAAPAPKERTLGFNYPQADLPYIATFRYYKSGMPTNWVVATNIARTNISVFITTNGTAYGARVPIDAGIQLYMVTAIDTNGFESDFSSVLRDFTPSRGTNLRDLGTNQPVTP